MESGRELGIERTSIFLMAIHSGRLGQPETSRHPLRQQIISSMVIDPIAYVHIDALLNL